MPCDDGICKRSVGCENSSMVVLLQLGTFLSHGLQLELYLHHNFKLFSVNAILYWLGIQFLLDVLIAFEFDT